MGKLEDEVSAVAKALSYPFAPSKTALSTVGAAHSWPAFLGLLTWLRELLAYDRATAVVDAASDAASAATPGSGAHFWAYLCAAYTHYLAGADDEVAALEAAVDASFDAARAAEEALVAARAAYAAVVALLRERRETTAVARMLTEVCFGVCWG